MPCVSAHGASRKCKSTGKRLPPGPCLCRAPPDCSPTAWRSKFPTRIRRRPRDPWSKRSGPTRTPWMFTSPFLQYHDRGTQRQPGPEKRRYALSSRGCPASRREFRPGGKARADCQEELSPADGGRTPPGEQLPAPWADQEDHGRDLPVGPAIRSARDRSFRQRILNGDSAPAGGDSGRQNQCPFRYAPPKESEPGGLYGFRHCELLAALHRQQLFSHPAAPV